MLLLLRSFVMKFVRDALLRACFKIKRAFPQPKLEPAGLIFQFGAA